MCSRPLEGERVDHQCRKVISDFPRFADARWEWSPREQIVTRITYTIRIQNQETPRSRNMYIHHATLEGRCQHLRSCRPDRARHSDQMAPLLASPGNSLFARPPVPLLSVNTGRIERVVHNSTRRSSRPCHSRRTASWSGLGR